MSNKEEFLRRAARLFEELEGADSQRDARNVEALWGDWERSMARSSRAKSIKTSALYLKTEVTLPGETFHLGDLKPSQLTAERLGAWLTSLETMPKKRGQGVLSDGTQYTLRANMNSFLDYLVEQGVLTKNNLRRLPFTKRIGKRIGYFAPGGELEEFLACWPIMEADMMRVVAQSGGLRRTEIRTLLKSRVDHRLKTVTVRRKGGKWWLVLLTDQSYAIIKKWSDVSPAHSDYVFADLNDPAGGPIKPGTFQSRLKRAQERFGRRLAGNERPCPHHLRHGLAFELMELKADPRDIADQMGLTSAQQLLETYARLRGGAREDFRATANQNRLLGGPDVGKKARG
jgi:integrase